MDGGRRRISSGSKFEALAGYSRAVVDGEWVFVSGTTGYDYATMTLPEDAAAQARQALGNIAAALAQAGAGLGDVVRVQVFLARREDFLAVAEVMGEHFRDIRPANTTVVAALVEPAMKVEIEVTARLGPRVMPA